MIIFFVRIDENFIKPIGHNTSFIPFENVSCVAKRHCGARRKFCRQLNHQINNTQKCKETKTRNNVHPKHEGLKLSKLSDCRLRLSQSLRITNRSRFSGWPCTRFIPSWPAPGPSLAPPSMALSVLLPHIITPGHKRPRHH